MKKPIVRVVASLLVGLAFGFVFGRMGRKPAPRPGIDWSGPASVVHEGFTGIERYQPFSAEVNGEAVYRNDAPEGRKVAIVLAGGKVVIGAVLIPKE